MVSILGINAYHGDASAAIVVDGQLIAAVEEERFNRIKHWAGFPAASIRYCLEQAGLTIDQVDHVAISFHPKANLPKRLAYVMKQRPSVASLLDRLRRQGKTLGLEQQLAEACGVEPGQIKAKLHRLEHHQTHVASGFLISPFERAAILSVDGMGDFVSTMTALGQGADWEVLDRVYYPHSLGFLYNAVTIYLGFPHYGDEYKVMGLAPYGKPEFADVFRKMVSPKGDGFRLNLDYFTHHTEGIRMAWNDGAPRVEPFHSDKLVQALGPMRQADEPTNAHHENIAASLQLVTEEIIFHLLDRLHQRTGLDQLCLAGGVAMNSVANGKITRNTRFKEIYVPAGAADNGTSFGAAFHVWNRQLKQPRTFIQRHAYLGCAFTPDECEEAIKAKNLNYTSYGESELLDATVDALCNGKVIGWFQGNMEFGARALGHRSLIADPRRTDMRDLINLKIKFREKFRPFAPSILAEHVSEFFELDEPSPFMERVLPIREEKRSLIPAVTHVDGSGRLQTVSKETSPLYYALIERFRQRTGIPIILNTSLNENEPVVRTPTEALACFLRTSMDVMVLGPHMVSRDSMGK